MSDRLNTIFGWILFAGVVALALSAISSRIFSADRPDRPEQLGYVIEGAEEAGAADAGPSLAMLLAEGSVTAGEASYAKCLACHTVAQGGANGIGPNLYAVMGTVIGSHVPGYAYSSALAGRGGNWGFEEMDEWLRSPRSFAPGTKMSFAGLSNPQERANVILYMLANGGGPALPVPEAPEPEVPEGADEGEGPVAGAPIDPVEAVGGMSAEQPVPSN